MTKTKLALHIALNLALALLPSVALVATTSL